MNTFLSTRPPFLAHLTMPELNDFNLFIHPIVALSTAATQLGEYHIY
jgi:hypothetical protein